MRAYRTFFSTVGQAFLSLWMAAACLIQFTGSGAATHYVIVALVSAVCWLLVRRAVSRANRRTWVLALAFGFCMAVALVVGAGIRAQTGLLPASPAWMIAFRTGGLWALIGVALAAVLPVVPQEGEPAPLDAFEGKTHRRFFFCAWGAITLCWLPYFLFFYPAVCTYDTIDQYAQIITGVYSNHHPVLHTLLMGLFVKVGSLLRLPEHVGVAMMGVCQMLAMAALGATVGLFLRRRARAWVAYAVLGFYALNPLHAFFSLALWKDIPFSAAVTVLVMMIWRGIESRGAVFGRRGFSVAYLCVLVLLAFFRNNGIIVLVGSLPFLWLWCKSARRFIACSGAGVLAVFLVVQLWGWSAMGVEQPHMVEALAIPLQQIGHTIQSQQRLTEAQEQTLSRIMPLERWAQVYDPVSADRIKQHADFDHEALESDPVGFARTWFQMGLAHPVKYLEAHAGLTHRYWYPDQSVLCYFWVTEETKKDVTAVVHRALVPRLRVLKRLEPMALTTKYPVTWPFLASGFPIWYVLFAGCWLVAQRRSRFLLAIVPLVVLWASLMVLAPIAEPRYIYALYLAAPLLLGLTAGGKGRPAKSDA